MSIFKRIKNIVKAEANDLVDKMEDPVKGITQIILDLEKDYESLSKDVSLILADVNAIKKRYDDKIHEVNECTEKAKRLAQAGSDDMTEMAKQMLMRRDKAQAEADSIKVQLDNQKAIADEHTENLRSFQNSINDAKSKKAELIARANSAKANAKLTKTLNNMSSKGSSSLNDFDRMTNKIEDIENKAKGMSDLNNAMSDPVEAKLRELEKNGTTSKNYDDELAKLLEE